MQSRPDYEALTFSTVLVPKLTSVACLTDGGVEVGGMGSGGGMRGL